MARAVEPFSGSVTPNTSSSSCFSQAPLGVPRNR